MDLYIRFDCCFCGTTWRRDPSSPDEECRVHADYSDHFAHLECHSVPCVRVFSQEYLHISPQCDWTHIGGHSSCPGRRKRGRGGVTELVEQGGRLVEVVVETSVSSSRKRPFDDISTDYPE
ncbi:hypothetical protein TSUD_388970 [Trifolium subterraneum]|uniref:Uncharacterized protein n=1 Tax=Trifolium subterraneum TaxID=3900 RepID=A0A2Z6LWM2_TRISU|nr:hypothetical protein TSUD_388970 [Trifolium subterraneum]